MTPTQLKEAAQVMVAASEGKQVQCRESSSCEWKDVHHPRWDWNTWMFRVKPEPREWYLDLVFARIYAEAPCRSANVIKVREVIE